MEHAEEHKGHIVEYGTFIGVWVGLLILTALTVAASGIRLQVFSVGVAVLIATVKSILVVSVFMHLRYENRLYAGFLFIVIIFLAISLILTFVDIF